nr:hypothetical protein [Tanacetum cinerariifolium]
GGGVDVSLNVAKFLSNKAKRTQKKSMMVNAHLIGRIARLMAMDDMLGDIDSNIYTFSNKVEDLTEVVSRMSEQYDQFYGEFDRMRLEPDRFHTWNTDHMSQLLSYHYIDHTRYDGTRYSYVPNMP